MGRPRKYTGKKLKTEVQRYFMSISREITVTEKKPSGGKDEYGHEVMISVPVLNQLGEEMKQIEFMVPPYVGGLCRFLGITRETWSQWGDAERFPEFADTITRARGVMMAWNEEQLLTRKGSETKGIIFNLQNNYGYTDKAAVTVTGSVEEYLRGLDEGQTM